MVGSRKLVVQSDFYTKLNAWCTSRKKKTSSSPIMWHMYAKRTIGWIIRCPSSRASRRRGKEVRDQPQRDRGRALGTMRTWQCEEIERGTHACRASTLGPVERWWTQDTRNHNPRPPPRVRKTDTFIVFYLLVLHSVTCLKTCRFTACSKFTSLWAIMSVFYLDTVRDVITGLLMFAEDVSQYLHISTSIYRGTHTHKHTCTINTQEE